MTITINGPDGSTFNFPDDTAPDTIRGAMQQHYGPPQAPQAAPSGPAPSGQDVSAIAAAENIPVVGPYAIPAAAHMRSWVQGGDPAQHKAQLQADVAAYRQQHPVRSAIEGAAIGSLPYVVAGEFAGPAKLLGMTGRLATAAPTAAATGAGIGAIDALTRGEDPKAGAISGALTAAGGVAAGKGAGMIYDAARGMFRPAATQRFLPGGPIAGVDIPASESQIATAMGRPDVNATREEERMRKAGVPTAVQADQATSDAMRQAHANFSAQLDPTGTSTTAPHPLDAAEAAHGDLVAQEQQRAAAEVARIAGARADTGQIRQALAGPAAPLASVSDVGDAVSQGIANRFQQARAGVNANYQDLANVPGEFNPRYLLNAGENRIRPALDDPSRVGLPRSERVYVKPDLMPQTSAALGDIDHEMGQLALTNDVARGNRPITSSDIEEVRKLLVQRQQAANQAARATGNWQDVRGMRRLMQEFDRHMLDVVTAPGGFSGDAQAYMDAQQAARQSHANMRRLFSRQGAGDKVGTFMENVIGKFPGQEMSPDKIVSTLMGSPDRPGTNEAAVPILNHLRDNVFGPMSPEWGQIKQGMVGRLTDTPPGAEPLPLPKLADRIERFLGNERHANAILDPVERADLQAHADNMRAAPDIAPATGTAEQKIAQLSGRVTGQPGTASQLLSELLSDRGEHFVRILQQTLTPERMAELKQAVFRKIAQAPEGMTPWEHQKTGQQIAKFLNTPAARALYTPGERMVMQAISAAHLQLVPIKAGTNPSGTAHMLEGMLDKMSSQLTKNIAAGIGSTIGGLHGAAAGHMAGKILSKSAERLGARRQAARAAELFIGPRPTLAPARLPQRLGATIGQQRLLRGQSE